MIQIVVECFNMLFKECDDLQDVLKVISEDLDDVKSCMCDVVLEFNIIDSKVVKLEYEVKEVISEVEILKEKF